MRYYPFGQDKECSSPWEAAFAADTYKKVN